MSLSKNKKRQYRYIINIYDANKEEDIPDTFIVRRIFPKHGIFISYRQWSRIKHMDTERYISNQLSLFS